MGRTERAAVGLAAGLLLLSACGANTPPAPLHSVTLVAKSTQTEFWLSVFAGAEAAAAEYNLELTTVGPETEEDYETQNEMIARAVEAGTEALVFSAIDFEKNAPAVDAAAQAGVRIVSIDSGVDSSQVSTYIGTDNYAAGQMAAQAALEQVEGPLSVGLVNYDEGTANGQERERGVLDALAQCGRASVAAEITTLVDAGLAASWLPRRPGLAAKRRAVGGYSFHGASPGRTCFFRGRLGRGLMPHPRCPRRPASRKCACRCPLGR